LHLVGYIKYTNLAMHGSMNVKLHSYLNVTVLKGALIMRHLYIGDVAWRKVFFTIYMQ